MQMPKLIKEKMVRKQEYLSLKNSMITNFIIKCVNPLLVNGILEMINMPEDPIDFLVSF